MESRQEAVLLLIYLIFGDGDFAMTIFHIYMCIYMSNQEEEICLLIRKRHDWIWGMIADNGQRFYSLELGFISVCQLDFR